jgi:DNA repair protein RadC
MIILHDKKFKPEGPRKLARVLQGWLTTFDEIDRDKEHGVIVALNVRGQVIVYDWVCSGILNSAVFHPREVFRRAIAHGAASIILSHTHPSGDCSPSDEDCAFTKRAQEAGTVIGIEVVDHIIFSTREYYSFVESGQL